MNWRALSEHPWFTRETEADTCSRMRALFSTTDRTRKRWTEPTWSKWMLLTDAKGRSLVARHWTRLFRRDAA